MAEPEDSGPAEAPEQEADSFDRSDPEVTTGDASVDDEQPESAGAPGGGGEQRGRETVPLSHSVDSAVGQFQETDPVSAAALVDAILDQANHRDGYAGGRASGITLAESADAERRPAGEWLAAVRELFDPGRAEELHGRLVIVGLSILDAGLREQLQQNGFLAGLEEEIQEPIGDLLTPLGWQLRTTPDSVPNQPDDPLETIGNDQLGRAAFADYLARRIDAVPESNSYAIHLDGPWGAGKSTVLNFLDAKLRERSDPDDRWLVVRFNAWQHQHIQPPWWPLMDQVFRESEPELRRRDRVRENLWRFSAGRLPFILGILALTLLVAVALPTALRTVPGDTPVLSYLATNAEAISAVVALAGVAWAGTQAASKPFLLRSAAAAQSYVDYTANPMNEIKDRFTTLVDRIPVRVAVFVDDLDRCESAYVLELLEGIQTLFKEAPVVYVVAADRRWVTTCFEQEYDSHASSVREPGKPLGTLFLEKHFQVSTPLPGISDELKRKYWQDLIQVQSGDESETSDEELSALLERISEMQTEGEIRRTLEESGDRSFREERAIREEAVKRIASTDIERRSEHLLKPFASLLEPNPRAMKRLVNAYNIHLALMTIAELDVDRDHLALWTILTLNWPQLARYLGDDPEMVEQIKQQDTTGVSSEMEALFTDPDVIDVVTGEPLTAELTPGVVEKCAVIRA